MEKSKKISKNFKNISKPYLIYGKHAVESALNNVKRKKVKLYTTHQNASNYKNNLQNIKVEVVEKNFFESNLSSDSTHQNIAIEVFPLDQPPLEQLITNKIVTIIILDKVTDPYNVGSILRTAAAFNVAAVVNTINDSPPENATIAKASCGGIEIVPYIRVTNIKDTITFLKKHGFWCYGLDGSAEKEINFSHTNKICLVFGSEGSGLRTITKKYCDDFYKISISEQMESLNISNAVAITLYSRNTGVKV
jgi:23S rRNA (guanosine2251-2'-O)-methyltransferase